MFRWKGILRKGVGQGNSTTRGGCLYHSKNKVRVLNNAVEKEGNKDSLSWVESYRGGPASERTTIRMDQQLRGRNKSWALLVLQKVLLGIKGHRGRGQILSEHGSIGISTHTWTVKRKRFILTKNGMGKVRLRSERLCETTDVLRQDFSMFASMSEVMLRSNGEIVSRLSDYSFILKERGSGERGE